LKELTLLFDYPGLVMTTSGKAALIVDDEPAVRMLLERVVEILNVQPISVGSVEEALHVIATAPNLGMVFVDLYLPAGSGWDVLAELRRNKSTQNLPAVLMTGMTLKDADRARLIEYNATLLDKGGFNIASIRELISNMLART